MLRQIRRRQVLKRRKAHRDSMKAEYKRYVTEFHKNGNEGDPLPRRIWEADHIKNR